MASSVDPDETARYESSHLVPHCLQIYLYWSLGIKGLVSYLIRGLKTLFVLNSVNMKFFLLMNNLLTIANFFLKNTAEHEHFSADI